MTILDLGEKIKQMFGNVSQVASRSPIFGAQQQHPQVRQPIAPQIKQFAQQAWNTPPSWNPGQPSLNQFFSNSQLFNPPAGQNPRDHQLNKTIENINRYAFGVDPNSSSPGLAGIHPAILDQAALSVGRAVAPYAQQVINRAPGIIKGVKAGAEELANKVAPQAGDFQAGFAKIPGKISKELQPLAKEAEIKRVGNNILKNNPVITQKDAEAMARDVIENRKFNQATGGVKGFQPPVELPSEILRMKPIEGKIINPPGQVSGVRQFFDRTRNVIASQGQAGQELARKLQVARDMAETSAGNWVSQLPTVRGLGKDEFVNFVDVAEGNARPISARVAQAAQEWAGVRSDIYNRAKSSGLDIGQLENYFPHRYDPNMFKGNNFVKAVQHLVETGQAQSADEAAQLLRHAQDTIRNRRQGNLEIERLVNLPGYEKTKDALFGYIDSASNRMSQVQHFGPDDSIAMQLINRVGQEGGDAATVKNMFDTAVGAKQYGELQKKVSGGLRAFNTVTKLGLGAITNTGQNVNTATVVGSLRTLLNAPKAAFSPEAKDFALKAGTTLDTVINQLREGSGLSGGMAGKIGAPGFSAVEKFNRTLAAVAGRDYARSLATKGDAATLAKMGIRLEGNALTPEQEIQAARNIVERTQFKIDPQDLPGWTASPWGKVLTQFKSFSYNQTAFLGREVIGPALKGNYAPLVRFIAIGIPTGMALQTGKNILRNRKDEENPVKQVQQGFSQVGGFGLGGDIITGLVPMNGRYLDQSRATTMALGTLGGPTVGSAMDIYGGISQAVQGRPENLERSALRTIPFVGPTLQNTLLPYKSASGEVNQRFPIGGSQSAQATPSNAAPSNLVASSQTGSITTSAADLTPIQEAKIKDQINVLEKQQKEVLANNGTNIFGNQFGGLTEDQKNAQLTQLNSQISSLKDQLVTQTVKLEKEKSLIDSQYALQAQRQQRAEDYSGWVKSTETYLEYLKDYQNKVSDEKDKLTVQNKIEDLQTTLGKYKSYGGFKKGKKPAKITFKVAKAPKISSFKAAKRPKAPTIKIAKTPTFKATKPRSISIKTSYGKVPAVKTQTFKNSLTG